MAKREIYEQKTEALLVPILEEFGFELWDVEYVKEGSEFYLRAYIDKEGGITIDDCVDVSRKLSDKLDENDFIDGEYILEVSSPGLGRALKRDRDFEKSIGRDVDLKLYKAKDGVKEFTGTLLAYDKEKVVVDLSEVDEAEGADNAADAPTGTEFLRSELASIKLHIEF